MLIEIINILVHFKREESLVLLNLWCKRQDIVPHIIDFDLFASLIKNSEEISLLVKLDHEIERIFD